MSTSSVNKNLELHYFNAVLKNKRKIIVKTCSNEIDQVSQKIINGIVLKHKVKLDSSRKKPVITLFTNDRGSTSYTLETDDTKIEKETSKASTQYETLKSEKKEEFKNEFIKEKKAAAPYLFISREVQAEAEKTAETQAEEYVNSVLRVNEIALPHLKIASNAIVGAISAVFALFSKPFVALYDAIHDHPSMRTMWNGTHSQATLIAQLDFVSKILDAEDPIIPKEIEYKTETEDYLRNGVWKERTVTKKIIPDPDPLTRTQQLSQALKNSITNAQLLRQAASESGSNYKLKKTKEGEVRRKGFFSPLADRAIQNLTANIKLSSSPVIIPISVGNGINALNHFLIINRLGSQYTIQHMKFSSANLEGKIFPMQTYSCNNIDLLVSHLVHVQTTDFKAYEDRAKESDAPTIYYNALDEFLISHTEKLSETNLTINASRDPVKAIFYVLHECSNNIQHPIPKKAVLDYDDKIVKPEYNPPADVSLGLLEDKTSFYTTYVKHLISYYEINTSTLSSKDQLDLLKTIQKYISKTRHYMEKDFNLEMANSIMEPLEKWVSASISKFDEIKKREESTIDSLNQAPKNAEVSLNTITVSDLQSEALKNKSLDAVKLSSKDFEQIKDLKKLFEQSNPTNNERKKTLDLFVKVSNSIDNLIEHGQIRQARLLAKELIHLVPPPTFPSLERISFWEAVCNSSSEVLEWSEKLTFISERIFESVFKLGDTHLSSDEVVDFNINLPLVLRKLFAAQIRLEGGNFQRQIDQYNSTDATNADKIKKMNEINLLCVSFIKKRQNEIKVELKARWKGEDAIEAERKKLRAENEKHIRNNQSFFVTSVPLPPDLALQKQERETLMKDLLGDTNNLTIGQGSKDKVILRLQHVMATCNTINANGNIVSQAPLQGALPDNINTIIQEKELFGHILRIIEVSKKDIATHYLKDNPLAISFKGINHKILFYGDATLIQAMSKESQKRFKEIQYSYSQMKSVIEGNFFDLNEYSKNLAILSIGYENHSDKFIWSPETRDSSVVKFVSKRQKIVQAAFYGFHDSESAEENFVPAAKSILHRHDHLMKAVEKISEASHYSPTIFSMIANIFKSNGGNDKERTLTRKKQLQSLRRIHMGYSKTYSSDGLNECLVFGENQKGDGGIYCFGIHSLFSEISSDDVFNFAIDNRLSTFTDAPKALIKAASVTNELSVVDSLEDSNDHNFDHWQQFKLHLLALDATAAEAHGAFENEVGVALDSTNNYFTVKGIFDFIYNYPRILDVEAAQQVLFERLFQSGVVIAMLKSDPQFFIDLKPHWENWISFFTKQDNDKPIIFLRDCAQRIRSLAMSVCPDEMYQKISNSLPVYDQKSVLFKCLGHQDDETQKYFAVYTLSYYLNNAKVSPSYLNHMTHHDWSNILKAYYIIQASPIITGHPFLINEVLNNIHSTFLTPLDVKLRNTENPEKIPGVSETLLRDVLLNGLAGLREDESTWTPVPNQEFIYQDQEGRIINLITCEGCQIEIKTGREGQLPYQIIESEEYKFLFSSSQTPLVRSVQEKVGTNNVMKYKWQDRDSGVNYLSYIDPSTKKVIICQVTEDNKVYQFSIRDFAPSGGIFAALKTIKEVKNKINGQKDASSLLLFKYIKRFGTWTNVKNKSDVIVARHNQNIEEEPIHLNVKNNHVKGAYIESNGVKKWICDELSSTQKNLLACRNTDDLLLLRSEGSQLIDEIRIPMAGFEKESEIDNTINQATLNNSDIIPNRPETLILIRKGNDRWEVANREGWVWQMKGTADLEKRFGERYREFMIPLKNEKTDECEIWFWGHPLFMSGKEKFFNPRNEYKIPLPINLPPPGFKYVLDKTGEFSSHAGFLYLSYLAFCRNDISEASRLLSLMVENGISTSSLDIENLESVFKLISVSLVGENLDALHNLPPTFESSRRLAFLLKSTLSLISSSEKLLANHPSEREKLLGVIDFLSKKMSLNSVYLAYSRKLEKNYQDFEDNGLLLTEYEKNTLNKIINLDHVNFWSTNLHLYETKRENYLPAFFEMPSTVEFQKFIKSLETCISPDIVSVNELHKKYGAYPIKETILSHFWSYWKWIAENDIEERDLSFLYTPISNNYRLQNFSPELLVKFKQGEPLIGEKILDQATALFGLYSLGAMDEEVEVARRLLLSLYHYKKMKSNSEEPYKFSDGNHKAFAVLHEHAREAAKKFPSLKGLEDTGFELLLGVYNSSGSILKMLTSLAYGKLWTTFVLKKVEDGKPILKDLEEFSKYVYEMVSSEDIGDNVFTSSGTQDKVHFQGTIDKLKAHDDEMDAKSTLELELIVFTRKCEIELEKRPIDNIFARQSCIENMIRHASFQIDLRKITIDTDEEKNNVYHQNIRDYLCRALNQSSIDNCNAMIKDLYSSFPYDYKQKIGLEVVTSQIHFIHQLIYSPLTEYQKTLQSKLPPPVKAAKIERNFETPIKVLQAKSCPNWNEGFEHKDFENWDKKREETLAFLQETVDMSDMQKAKFKTLREGVVEAAVELKEKSSYSLKVEKMSAIGNALDQRIMGVEEENKQDYKKLFDLAKKHAKAFGILPLFAKNTEHSEKIILKELEDLYKRGLIKSLLKDFKLTQEFEESMTAYLLSKTERQQLGKAKIVYDRMKDIFKSTFATLDYDARHASKAKCAEILQYKLDRSKDWLVNSYDLMSFLTQGSNRLRYAEKITFDGRTQQILRDQHLTRKYLVTEARAEIISRPKATKAIEQALDDTSAKARFIKVRMGLGKSTFIFPHLAEMMLEKGLDPVVVTTESLVPQLSRFLGPQAYEFNFDINYGIDVNNSFYKTAIMNKAEDTFIIKHLTAISYVLNNLKSQNSFPLTSPQRLASLRNKRIQLQLQFAATLQPTNDFEKNAHQNLIMKIELLKEIESFFHKSSVRFLEDEDSNLDISKEYNFAVDSSESLIDRVRYEVGQEIAIKMASHSRFKTMVLNNDLRTMDDSQKELREVVEMIYEDTNFWIQAGWTKDDWEKIDRKQFVDYICSERVALPDNLTPWDASHPVDKECPKAYVGILKTMISKTMNSVKTTHGKLQRGINSSDGCSIVPYSDGKETKNTRFGEDSEMVLHHIFHYAAAGTDSWFPVDQTKFMKIHKELKMRTDDKWKTWCGNLAALASKYEGKLFTAFCSSDPITVTLRKNIDSEEIIEETIDPMQLRLEFLKYVMFESGYVKVYTQQIVCNNQDVTLGDDVFVASGTGDAYALNLASPESDTSAKPNVITGETLLSANLNSQVDIFQDPIDYVKEKAKDKNCSAVMNQDFEIFGNKSEKVAAELRKEAPDRQQIFNESRRQRGQIWNPNDALTQPYDPRRVKKDGFFYYGPSNIRGTDYAIPKGQKVYGVLMVGLGTLLDDYDQGLWRMRQLGQGQRGEIAIDNKMETQVREVNDIPMPNIIDGRVVNADKSVIKKGHVVRAIIKRTIETEEIRHVKAVTFAIQKSLKQATQEQLRKPLISSFRKIASSVVYAASQKSLCSMFNHLVLMNKKNDYRKEFQVGDGKTNTIDDKIDREEFLITTCNNEIKKIEDHENKLFTELNLFLTNGIQSIATQSGVNNHLFINPLIQGFTSVITNLQYGVVGKDFDTLYNQTCNNLLLVMSMNSVTPDQLNTFQEYTNDFKLILGQWAEIAIKMQKAKAELSEEVEKVEKNDINYTRFQANNLPKKIARNFDNSTNNQQQVQQQQMQQQMQQVQQLQQVKQTVTLARTTNKERAFDLDNFIRICRSSNLNHDYVRTYKNHQAAKQVCKAFGVNAKNVFISLRAKELESKAEKGKPIFFQVLIKNNNNNTTYSIIISETDYFEKVGPQMEMLKTNKNLNVNYGFSIQVSPFSQKDYYEAGSKEGVSKDDNTGEPIVEYIAQPLVIDSVGPPIFKDDAEKLCLVNKLLFNWTGLRETEMKRLTKVIKELDKKEYDKLKVELEGENSAHHIMDIIEYIRDPSKKRKTVLDYRKNGYHWIW